MMTVSVLSLLGGLTLAWSEPNQGDDSASTSRTYANVLKPIDAANLPPLLGSHPEFVQPIREVVRFEAPILVNDPGADLEVRAWRFSYNARGVVEIPNRLRSDRTAVIVVHPWGVDDGQGWRSPEPAGCAFNCTPIKNRLALDHMGKVINPLLKSLRGQVKLIGYSLPGVEDPIRKKIYRSARSQPTSSERAQGVKELGETLNAFSYRGEPLPKEIKVSSETPTIDYFRQFPGLDATAKFNHEGFWDLPIPVAKPIETSLEDVVFYDREGYDLLRDYLKKQGVRHVLLTGYNTDMCVCSTTAGYKNLRQDFDVFLVGDATIATFPANQSPATATAAAVAFASLDLLITETSWIKRIPNSQGEAIDADER